MPHRDLSAFMLTVSPMSMNVSIITYNVMLIVEGVNKCSTSTAQHSERQKTVNVLRMAWSWSCACTIQNRDCKYSCESVIQTTSHTKLSCSTLVAGHFHTNHAHHPPPIKKSNYAPKINLVFQMDAESTYTSHQSDQQTTSDVHFTNASNGTLMTAAREPQREKKERHKLTASARN